MEYGYVRVSTKEQNEDRQIIAMREFGVAKTLPVRHILIQTNMPDIPAIPYFRSRILDMRPV